MVSDLTELVDLADPEIARQAEVALREMVPEIGAQFAGADPDAKIETLDMLEEMGGYGHEAIDDEALHDENEFVRQEAADALGEIAAEDDTETIAALEEALKDGSAEVRVAANRALKKPRRR